MKAFKKTSKIIAMASIAGLLTISSALAQEVYMQGTVLPTESGFRLSVDSGQNYTLEGREQELSRLVPRTVQITGDLVEGPSGKTIKVETLQDASNY